MFSFCVSTFSNWPIYIIIQKNEKNNEPKKNEKNDEKNEKNENENVF